MKRDLQYGVIFGVCAGLSNATGIDVSLLRLIFMITAIMGVGTPILIYFILAICMQPE